MKEDFMKIFSRALLLYMIFLFSTLVISCTSVKEKKYQVDKYKIGDIGPAGGIIFYTEEFPIRKYYEIAPIGTEIQGPWGLLGKKIGTSTSLGTGQNNTELIIKLLNTNEPDAAAQMCRNLIINGFNDWFLPSLDEVYLMYSNLYLKNIGSFNHMLYWSSSESKTNPLTSVFDFGEVTVNGGKEYPSSRNEKHQVRAIRAFSMNTNIREYQFGERGPAGGWIFFKQKKDMNSWSYLEAAPLETEFSSQWGLEHTTISTARGEWQSKSNTQKIIALLDSIGENGTAAQICDSLVINGYDDWFLPSADALLQIYKNVLVHEVSTSEEKIYWSSTESDYTTSLGLSVLKNNASINPLLKNQNHIVRAIREFY